MDLIEQLKHKYKVYDYLYGDQVPEPLIELYYNYNERQVEYNVLFHHFMGHLKEVLRFPTFIFSLTSEYINFHLDTTFDQFKDSIVQDLEMRLPYLDNEIVDKEIIEVFLYPKIYDKNLKKIIKSIDNEFRRKMIHYSFKEVYEIVDKTSDVNELKKWHRNAHVSEQQIRIKQEEIGIPFTKKQLLEYKAYAKELAEYIQEKIDGLDTTQGNEKAFEEFFLVQDHSVFCINLLKELGVSDAKGLYALGPKKRSSMLGYIHALKEHGFITYATEPEIMKALFSYLNTHYSRLKPESNTYNQYYNLTDSALKTYRK